MSNRGCQHSLVNGLVLTKKANYHPKVQINAAKFFKVRLYKSTWVLNKVDMLWLLGLSKNSATLKKKSSINSCKQHQHVKGEKHNSSDTERHQQPAAHVRKNSFPPTQNVQLMLPIHPFLWPHYYTDPVHACVLLMIHIHYLTSKNLMVTWKGGNFHRSHHLRNIIDMGRYIIRYLYCLLWVSWKWTNQQLDQCSVGKHRKRIKKGFHLEHSPPKWISRQIMAYIKGIFHPFRRGKKTYPSNLQCVQKLLFQLLE